MNNVIDNANISIESWRKVGDMLVEQNIISQNQLEKWLEFQKKEKLKWNHLLLGESLIQLKYISRKQFWVFIEKNKINVKILDLLVAQNKINRNQVEEILSYQESNAPNKKIWEIIVDDLKMISSEILIRCLAIQNNAIRIIPDIDLIDYDLFTLFKQNQILDNKFFPYKIILDEALKKETWLILIENFEPQNIENLKDLIYNVQMNYKKNEKLGQGIIRNKWVLNREDTLHYAKYPTDWTFNIEFAYSSWKEISDLFFHYSKNKKAMSNQPKIKTGDIAETKILKIGSKIHYESEILNIFQKMIFKRIEKNASDIHLEPMKNWLRLRYRIDWVMSFYTEYPSSLKIPFMRAIKSIFWFKDWYKIWVGIDERITWELVDKNEFIDLRVSILPMVDWDKMVIRILDGKQELIDFEELWMNPNVLRKYKMICWMSDGIILITWPTWSWKSTTLYTTLNDLNNEEINIMTIEEPIEYTINWVNQMNIWWKRDVAYADVLKSILRQDPDIIVYWEMRDKESAEVALTAWLTGHLLFSTLHTSDAVSAITRLIDMGIKPFLLGSTLVSSIWQRLVRKTCTSCSVEYKPSNQLLKYLDLYLQDFQKYLDKHQIKFKKWAWCECCNFTWYKGRIWIFEILGINENIKKAVLKENTADYIEQIARKQWMVSMMEDWVLKVIKGQTTFEELSRVFTKLQIPSQKRTIEEIDHLLNWDIDDSEIYKSIISWEEERKEDKESLVWETATINIIQNSLEKLINIFENKSRNQWS